MSKKDLSEQDIRTKHITPAIIKSGWDLHTQILEEVTFTAGRIIVRGNGMPQALDYAEALDVPFAFSSNGDGFLFHDRQESEQAWKVSVEQIKSTGYNLDIKNPNTVEEALGDPEELLTEYKALLVGVAETREALKTELMDALGGKNE